MTTWCPNCQREIADVEWSRPRRIFDPGVGWRTKRQHRAQNCGVWVLERAPVLVR